MEDSTKKDLIQSSEIDMDSLFDLSAWDAEEGSVKPSQAVNISPKIEGSRSAQADLELPAMGNAVVLPAAQPFASGASAKTQPTQTQSVKTQPTQKSSAKYEPRRFTPLKFAAGLTLRLLGLGVAGVLATLGGMAIAHFFYSPRVENPPLLETALDKSARGLGTARDLPKTAAQALIHRLDPPPQPNLDAAAPILTDSQRQQISREIATLQNELAQINTRTAALEQQLGYSYPEAPMDLRMEALSQTVVDPAAGPMSVANRDRDRQPLLVTLPLDPLFADGQSSLKPASTTLLGAILTELRAYPAGVVTVGSYTDDVGTGVANRDLSLRRAQAVARYLQIQVGDSPENLASNRFLWSTAGYGNALPLAPNSSDENRQRNRRLEIRVTPR